MSGGIMINEYVFMMQKIRVNKLAFSLAFSTSDAMRKQRCFFIGESDSEDEEQQQRDALALDVDSWSIESDLTDEATDVIGGAPSTLPFIVGDDDDSGVGAEFVAGLSVDDDEPPLSPSPLPLVVDAAPPSPLLPVPKSVAIGAKSVPTTKFANVSPMRRYRKRSFFGL